MGPHNDIYLSIFEIFKNLARLSSGSKTADHLYFHRGFLESILKCLKVLKRQYRGRNKNRDLFSV